MIIQMCCRDVLRVLQVTFESEVDKMIGVKCAFAEVQAVSSNVALWDGWEVANMKWG